MGGKVQARAFNILAWAWSASVKALKLTPYKPRGRITEPHTAIGA